MNVVKASPSAAMAQTTQATIARALTGAAFPRAFTAATSTRAGALPRQLYILEHLDHGNGYWSASTRRNLRPGEVLVGHGGGPNDFRS